MVAVLIGLIFLNQPLTQVGVMNINGAIFLFLTNMTFQNVFAVINVSLRFAEEVFITIQFSGSLKVDKNPKRRVLQPNNSKISVINTKSVFRVFHF